MTLLDVGCGWGGATMMRAIEKYDVNVIGLTLSKNQRDHVEQVFAESGSPRSKRIELMGWEEFDEPVDRIVSIGAFEHFGFDRYDDFFNLAYRVLPDDGVMLLHTITSLTFDQMVEKKIPLTFEAARFAKFILTEIFPGGRLRRRRRSTSTQPRPASRSLARSRCNRITRAPWTVGPLRWRPTATRRLRCSPRSLRPLHEVPHRVRPRIPGRVHRR